MTKVFIQTLENGYDKSIAEGFEFCRSSINIQSGDRICIKPNLTFPTFRPGVMTNPEALEALIKYLKNYTDRITICESDSGGYNRFSMDEVFESTGIKRMAKQYGIALVNMSREPSRPVGVSAGSREISVPLPTLLLDDTDLFITMPVPKIHMNTTVSLSLKNQWGVIQQPSERLKLHPYFKYVIYAICKSLPRSVSIIDGKYGLTRSGPLKGDPVELNWLMVADNLFAADFVCSHLMGIDPFSISYLRYALEKENILDFSTISMNCEYKDYVKKQPFYLKREWTDYPGVLTFNSRFLAYIGYESFLAKPLHRLLYKFREPFYDYNS